MALYGWNFPRSIDLKKKETRVLRQQIPQWYSLHPVEVRSAVWYSLHAIYEVTPDIPKAHHSPPLWVVPSIFDEQPLDSRSSRWDVRITMKSSRKLGERCIPVTSGCTRNWLSANLYHSSRTEFIPGCSEPWMRKPSVEQCLWKSQT